VCTIKLVIGIETTGGIGCSSAGTSSSATISKDIMGIVTVSNVAIIIVINGLVTITSTINGGAGTGGGGRGTRGTRGRHH
jgi:hypothetical protein